MRSRRGEESEAGRRDAIGRFAGFWLAATLAACQTAGSPATRPGPWQVSSSGAAPAPIPRYSMPANRPMQIRPAPSVPVPAIPGSSSLALREKPITRAAGEKTGRNEIALRIERLWVENGFTYADVFVQNTSPYELEEITIKCTAFGRGLVNLDFREQTLLTNEEGRMLPGFSKKLKVRLQRGGFDVKEMSCNAKGW